MNTLDILIYICEKREEFVGNGLNAQDALAEATNAIAEDIDLKKMSLNRIEIFLIILLLLLALMMVFK
ncbi:MAG: hypothetical protein EPN24_02680 [Candidatus Methanoperedens sp.]|nr:MAG: hypothetical protein EPN24_02680 [Candidatus Methanoperedens sp.]